MIGTPTHRAPTHPGEMLSEEFLRPLHLKQKDVAAAIGISLQRLNEIVKGKRGITPDTAIRFAKYFGTTPELWLNLQSAYDLHEALGAADSRAIERIKPIAVLQDPAVPRARRTNKRVALSANPAPDARPASSAKPHAVAPAVKRSAAHHKSRTADKK